MSVSSWIEFAKDVAPLLLELASDLFHRHNGNTTAAKAEIKRIRDHGARFVSAVDALDDEIAAQQKRGG
jgi:hypothetical protein